MKSKFIFPVLLVSLFFQNGFSQKNPEEVAVISTPLGKMVIGFYEKEAPNHVKNFKELVKKGFYNGTFFHRIAPGYVIQGGDPFSKDTVLTKIGKGGPGYTLSPEIKMPHILGAVAAARKPNSPNSNGSQFYICLRPQPKLDGGYTVFGHVIAGMDVAKKISEGQRNTQVKGKKSLMVLNLPADFPLEPVNMTITLENKK